MKWIHIDFWFWKNTFRTDAMFTLKQKKEFEKSLSQLITKSRPYINRKFFLYEDLPHCFLALELKSVFYIPCIDKIIKKQKYPEFIYKCQINTTAGNDQDNGDGFLDILVSFTAGKLNLTKSDTHAILEGQTHNGSWFIGEDTVIVRGKVK